MGEGRSRARGAPDGGVFLLVTDVRVLGEEDGVVGYCGLACGQDAPDQVAHHGQDPIVHEQVIHQELDRQRKGCVEGGVWSIIPLVLPTCDLGQSASLLRASLIRCAARVMTSNLHDDQERRLD